MSDIVSTLILPAMKATQILTYNTKNVADSMLSDSATYWNCLQVQPIEKAFVRGDEDIHKVLWKRKRNACVHMNHYRSSNVNEVIKTI